MQEQMFSVSLDATEESVRRCVADSEVKFNKNMTPEEQQEVINDMLTIRLNDKVRMKSAAWRHVILVGKSKSGKSQTRQVLKELWAPTSRSTNTVFAKTRDAESELFTLVDEDTNMNYNVAVIDTPGLSEVTSAGGSQAARSDQELLRVIMACLDREVREVHAVLFVFTADEGLTKQEVAAVEAFAKLFIMDICAACNTQIWGDRYRITKKAQSQVGGVTFDAVETRCPSCYNALSDADKSAWQHVVGMNKNCALLSTMAEHLPQEEKDQLQSQLQRARQFDELTKVVDGKMFFMGTVRGEEIDQGEARMVRDAAENVEEMRKKLFQFIFTCDPPFPIENLPVFAQKRNEINKLLAELDHYDNLNDKAKVDEVLLKLKENHNFVSAENIEHLGKINRARVEARGK